MSDGGRRRDDVKPSNALLDGAIHQGDALRIVAMPSPGMNRRKAVSALTTARMTVARPTTASSGSRCCTRVRARRRRWPGHQGNEERCKAVPLPTGHGGSLLIVRLRSRLRLAVSLCRDPGAHVLRAVDESNPRGLQARQKLDRRPVDQCDVLEIEDEATARIAREVLLQSGGVLAIDVSTHREHDRVPRR